MSCPTQPKKPAHLPDFSEACLRALVDCGLADKVVLGGALGLLHFARRSALLEPPARMPWIDVPLDSFADLVASKMTALVERGAPRDFRDIHALCQAGLASVEICWALWEKRQALAGSDTARGRAYLAIETHLMRIAQHRLLADITDMNQRLHAEQLHTWFREVFLRP